MTERDEGVIGGSGSFTGSLRTGETAFRIPTGVVRELAVEAGLGAGAGAGAGSGSGLLEIAGGGEGPENVAIGVLGGGNAVV